MQPIFVPSVAEFDARDINEKHTASFVFVGEWPALPLLFSVEARAEGIPEWDGPDYQFSAYISVYYEDGSCLNETYLCFAPGNHAWQKLDLYIRPRLKITRICINYFFEHKAGKVAYRNAKVEECAQRPQPDRRIVLLGDSNVCTSYLASADRIDAILQKQLGSAFPSLTIEVENSGHNGESVKSLFDRKRYERDLLTLDRIDVIFIRYGGNDRKIYDAAEYERLQRELIQRLRRDFPAVKIVLETGTFVDYPLHYSSDVNLMMAPYHQATRNLAPEVDGLLDVYELMKSETEKGNWDFRYRSHPQWKLVLDGRFDREHNFAPAYYSNVHHNPNCNRLVAQATYDLLIEKKMI